MPGPQGLVTLTTDFGLADPFVGQMKLALLARCPSATLVDLTHAVTPFRAGEAGFWLARSLPFFPPASLHVAVVDPGVGTSRRLLAARVSGQFFLAPDNGLLAQLLEGAAGEVRGIPPETLSRLAIPPRSATFHGRDVFAPIAGEWLAGRISFEQLGPVVDDWQRGNWPRPRQDLDGWSGEIVIVDNFGNLFSNIEINLNVKSHSGVVRFGQYELPWVRTYGEAPAGTAVALVNAFGVIEAAVVEGRADRTLKLEPGSPVRWSGVQGG